MGDYATTDDIRARLPGRTIDATSAPTTTQVTAWITESEAELNGYLAGAGYGTPITGAAPVALCRSKVASYVAGRCERAYASGTDLDADTGSDLIQEFRDFLDMIRLEPERIGNMLGSSTGAGDVSLTRSYWTDNTQGESASDGDFDPTFKRGMDW